MSHLILGVTMINDEVLAFSATDQVKSFAVADHRGIIAELDISCPQWTANPNLVITLERSDGTVAWTGEAIVKGSGVTYTAQFPIDVSPEAKR